MSGLGTRPIPVLHREHLAEGVQDSFHPCERLGAVPEAPGVLHEEGAELAEEDLVRAHHGSLAREQRLLIEQMLKEMQSAVSASVMGMDKFSEEIRRNVGEVRAVTDHLSGMMDQVRKLAPQFDAVLQGMQAQAVGAQQISETMMQLNDATQQTVESLKATSEAVHQLQFAARDLQSSVATFAVNT